MVIFRKGQDRPASSAGSYIGSTAASLANRGPSRRGIKPTTGGWTEVPAFFKNFGPAVLQLLRIATELYRTNLRAALHGYRVEYHDNNQFFVRMPEVSNWRYPATGGVHLYQVRRFLDRIETMKGK